jgi:hypothetical protein
MIRVDNLVANFKLIHIAVKSSAYCSGRTLARSTQYSDTQYSGTQYSCDTGAALRSLFV